MKHVNKNPSISFMIIYIELYTILDAVTATSEYALEK